jgi:hypothetical protein
VLGGLVAAGGAAAIAGASVMSSREYDAILAEQLRPLPDDADAVELVRYATLAASSHNTQPWRFRIAESAIAIEPDFRRRTPVVDPDDHHLFASLGCAAENLSLAARARGRSGEVATELEGEGRVVVSMAAGSGEEPALFAAIRERQSTRTTYDGSPVSADAIDRLTTVAQRDDVELVLAMDDRLRDGIVDLTLAGNGRQLDDPVFRGELKSWLRFNAGAAAATRDGLFSAASGNPRLPSWLGPFLYDLTVRKDGDNQKLAEQMRSSSGIAVFVAASDNPAGWIAAGRAYQRFALQATLDGLKHAFVNQAVEVPGVRHELGALLGIGDRRPNLVVRFGRGPEMPRSLRRATDDVIVPAAMKG